MINKKKLYLKSLSRKIFWTEFVLFSLIFGTLSGLFFYASTMVTEKTASIGINKIYPPDLQGLTLSIIKTNDIIPVYIIPGLLSAIFLFTFISWLLIRSFAKNTIEITSSAKPSQTNQNLKKENPELEKKKFLHFLSVLQEDGRLLDFLSEDLNSYEDEEIGAAVRSIHKGCKDGIEKYLELEPILEEDEDESIEIQADFDPDKIKLTGNVVGNPPFKGIVRHRGWRIKSFNMPDLKKVKDASFIVPAEVDVE